jgi:hypothetical protein
LLTVRTVALSVITAKRVAKKHVTFFIIGGFYIISVKVEIRNSLCNS